MGLVKLAQILAALLPLIHQAVLLAEQSLGAGQGAQKLDQVLSTVEATLPAVGAAAGTIEQLRAPVAEIVGGLVNTFNLAGLFKKPAA